MHSQHYPLTLLPLDPGVSHSLAGLGFVCCTQLYEQLLDATTVAPEGVDRCGLLRLLEGVLPEQIRARIQSRVVADRADCPPPGVPWPLQDPGGGS